MGLVTRDHIFIAIVAVVGLGAIYYGIFFRAPVVEQHRVFIRSCILTHSNIPSVREYCDALWDLQDGR